MLLIATDLGLSSCWVGAFNEEKISTLVNIPKDVKPSIILTIGYSNTKPEEKYLSGIKELFYFEEWGITIKNIDKIMGINTATFKDIITIGKEMLHKASTKIKEKMSRSQNP